MQASTSQCAWQCARSAIAAAGPRANLSSRNASTSSKAKQLKRKNRAARLAPPPSPTALPFSEAIRTLKAVSPGDTTSAFDLVLLSKLAASVNINSLRGRAFLPYDASNAKKKETIVVFAEGELAEQARREGADVIGGKELIDEVGQIRLYIPAFDMS